MTSTTTRLATATAAALALGAPAWAAGTWDFSVCNGSSTVAGTAAGSSSGASVGNSYSCAANGSTTRDLTVTAWGATSSTNASYSTAYVSGQGTDGFGVSAQSEGGAGAVSPNDALDNDPTTLAPNLILLKFNSAVILDKVTLGWTMTDADLTIMAYTGSSAPSSFINGKSVSNLTSGGASAGWSLVQNVGDVDGAYATGSAASSTNVGYSVNQVGVSSSYWLISAYNSGFGGGTMDGLVDYAKLLSVTTRDATAKVAEPASLALAAAALCLLWRSRRRTAPIV